ncbi:Epimerase family protein [Enhygromyxa salina]|uniref:Epimerase family protein n=1 Tax=Enhygromyxa salina TaxID=215803 RepID=A0A2S9XS16_9BACT|nr:TIGR01777 family oxidoreductase [Enhygromyxa salina]PRP95655.1 Epimerase family protein [Enhygromyxa salina]
MRVAITGASGLIGGALSDALRERGDEAVGISRKRGGSTILWDPHAGFEHGDALSGFDAVVNLAGESIAGRWTAAKKARIRDSRVRGTQTIIEALAQASPRPKVLVNASAVGLYGDRGDEVLSERSDPGRSDAFLVEVTQAWEATARTVEALDEPGVRLCLARFGVVLDGHGGALAKMLTPFRLGLGGKIGSGEQWMAWVHRQDVVDALLFMLDHDDARGAFNVVAPNPVRNADFTDSLARVLHRPSIVPLPKLAVRALLGQMGDALLLQGQRVAPMRLLEAGFEFSYPELEPALRGLL